MGNNKEENKKIRKNKLELIRAQGQKTLVAILVIGVAVYLGFTPLFDKIGGGVAGAVIGSSFGAIFVIVLTMYLLNKQTEIEQESKKGERVFDEKVKLYQQILNNTKEMVEDGKISNEEIAKLPFLMMELQMLGGDETISTYEGVFSKINEIFEKNEEEDIVEIDEKEKMQIYKEMSTFARNCRVDLGVSETQINEELFNRTINAIQKSSDLATANRRRSANANYVEDQDAFFKACEEKGRSKELVDLTKKLYNTLMQKYSPEGPNEEFHIDLAFGKHQTTDPKLSVKAAQANSNDLTRICTIHVTNKELQIHNLFKSPKWDYKQLKIGDYFFKHSRDFWKRSSFYNEEEEFIVFNAHRDYLPELRVNGITNLDEITLKILLFIIEESKKVVFENKKLPRTELLKAAEKGDEESKNTIKKYIAEDYTQEIGMGEIE